MQNGSILAGPRRCDCLLRSCHQHDQLFGERSHLPRCAVIHPDSVLDFDDASGRTATRSVDTIIAHISGRMSSRSIGSSRPTCMLTIFPPRPLSNARSAGRLASATASLMSRTRSARC